jgi:hypothetical protein
MNVLKKKNRKEKKMDGKLKVLRRKSKKGGIYDALVFFPDEDIAGMKKGIVVSFDKLTMYRLADAEGVVYEELVEEDF